jgi:hypothetical protein
VRAPGDGRFTLNLPLARLAACTLAERTLPRRLEVGEFRPVGALVGAVPSEVRTEDLHLRPERDGNQREKACAEHAHAERDSQDSGRFLHSTQDS